MSFSIVFSSKSESVLLIGVGDGGRGRQQGHLSPPPPSKKIGKMFFGNYYVKYGHFSGKNLAKFGNFVNFTYIFFRAKMSYPAKVD